jgi:hypothetical protein
MGLAVSPLCEKRHNDYARGTPTVSAPASGVQTVGGCAEREDRRAVAPHDAGRLPD